MNFVLQVVDGVIGLYIMLIVVQCLLSWFPNIRQYDQPFRTLNMLVNPVMDPIRRVIPPIGGMDISPMVLIIGLQLIKRVVVGFIQ